MLRIFVLILCCSFVFGQNYNFDTVAPYTLGGNNKGLVRPGIVGAWNLSTVNLLKYSEDFSNAAWSNNEATHTANTITFAASAASAVYQAANIPASTLTVSVLASSTTSQKFRINCFASADRLSSAFTTSETPTVFTYTFPSGGCDYFNIQNSAEAVAGVITVGYVQLNEGPTALPYVATTDLQTVPNLVAGGPSLQLGSTSGADTNDPVRRLAGMVFDGVDDFLVTTIALGSADATGQIVSRKTKSDALEADLFRYGNLQNWEQSGKLQAWMSTGSQAFVSKTAGDWSLFSSVYSSGNITAWNGIAKGSTQNPGAILSGTTLYVGSGTLGSYGYGGDIASFSFYNRALSPKEVRQNHQWLKFQMSQVGVTLP